METSTLLPLTCSVPRLLFNLKLGQQRDCDGGVRSYQFWTDLKTEQQINRITLFRIKRVIVYNP